MKLDDLTRLGNCAVCGRKQLDSPLPLFYVVSISRGGFDATALRRAAGLEMQVGGPLSRVLGPDEDLATVIDGPHIVFVHEGCAGDIGHLLELVPADKNMRLACGGEET